jgi:hypothetical protein
MEIILIRVILLSCPVLLFSKIVLLWYCAWAAILTLT